MTKLIHPRCPSCNSPKIEAFYQVGQVPVHSVLLHHTREEAEQYPKRDIVLGYCQDCGFVSNTAFDPNAHEYDAEYESTQAFSPTFNTFHHNLASDLVEKYDLRGKKVVEIGCGQGEFLRLLCEIGGNEGVGFDPAYIGPPYIQEGGYNLTFIPDYYTEKYADFNGDFFCCKMTLEHIHQTHQFISTVRKAIGEHADTVVFFQVPNARYVFGDLAFWDIYYEHCSYFTLGSLARLFRGAGFEVMDLWSGYDDQYIMIEARPGDSTSSQALPQEETLPAFRQEIERFTQEAPRVVQAWKDFFLTTQVAGRKVVLWGGGSKCVSFLTTLGISWEQVEMAVDVNPRKNNTYLAGSGQKVVSPETLKQTQPDVVVVMNPIYRDEIQNQLNQMGLHPELITVQDL
jgi:SAM-dependent methyltransferase